MPDVVRGKKRKTVRGKTCQIGVAAGDFIPEGCLFVFGEEVIS